MQRPGQNPGRCVCAMQIVPVHDVDIRSVPGQWPLTAEMRAASTAHWQRAVAANPHLWDGRILGFCAPGGGMPRVEAGMFRAEAREDAYSAFLYWRDAGFPDIGLAHAFGTALIVSGEGALIYGVMGAQTANAGRIYPPGGSLEPRDVLADGSIDVLGCIATELEEETGLRPHEARIGGLYAIIDGPRVSIGRVFHFAQSTADLLARIRANLDLQEERELADVIAIGSGREAAAVGVVPYAMAVAEAFEAGRLA